MNRRLCVTAVLFLLALRTAGIAGPNEQEKELANLLASLKDFRLDRPWATLDGAPDYVRRNRAAEVYVAGLLNSSNQAARDQIVRDFVELSGNPEELVGTAKQIDQDHGKMYRETLKFDVLRFLVEVISKGDATFHFSATSFNDAYFSRAEGRSQFFDVVLPKDYSPQTKYPLFVQMFGSTSMLPTAEHAFIRVKPNGRGVWGFRSMSRYDIMQVIEQAKLTYSVDENRVYMTGTSAGATGVMHAAALRQDVFAGVVPLVAFGNDLPLENFRSLPLRCEHGVNDWTSAICNVRVQFQRLKTLGYDAVLNEHPSAGHGIRTPPPPTMKWLFQQKRNPRTPHLVHTCEHPRDGRAYWLKIESFVDPHQIARIEAKVDADGLTIKTDNVRQFSFDPMNVPSIPFPELSIDGSALEFESAVKDRRPLFTKEKEWRSSLTRKRDPNARREYGAGAAANLFQGDPLLVVYGTGSDEAGNRFLQQAATVLARSGGPDFRAANVRFPIRADTKLDDLPLDKYNLLLVGTPDDNSYLQKIANKFPFTIGDGKLNAGDRKPLALDGGVLSFYFYNPEHPNRLIYIVSPYLNEAQQASFLENPRHFLAGSEGFKMIDQPDLLVRGTDRKIRREMQLDTDWKFCKVEGADRPIPNVFADRVHLARAHMKVMKENAKVDFAFWWGPEDKGLFGGYDFNWLTTFEPAAYTKADYLVRRRETETMTGELPGTELRDIYDRWIATKEIITWPQLEKQDIESDRTYKIVISMDLVPKLGIRRKVLSNVAPGPTIMPRQVADEVFRVER